MDTLPLLSFGATAVTLLFAGAVFNRYAYGRRMQSLLWGIGLLLYALATFAEAYLSLRWNAVLLVVWYVCGAMLTAAWLGQGTVYLLVRRRGWANGLTIGLALVSIVAVSLVSSAPITPAAFQPEAPLSTQYKALLGRGGFTILLTVLLNIYGTVWLVGGALWSAWLFWRKRVLLNRVIGNLFIGVGAFLPASAGMLIKLGLADWLSLSQLLGAVLMFIGFTLTTLPQPAAHAATP